MPAICPAWLVRIATEFDGRAMAQGTEVIYERLAEAKGIG